MIFWLFFFPCPPPPLLLTYLLTSRFNDPSLLSALRLQATEEHGEDLQAAAEAVRDNVLPLMLETRKVINKMPPRVWGLWSTLFVLAWIRGASVVGCPCVLLALFYAG